MGDVLVSVHCLTYNHEKYIVDAIDSFLMQKTNFKFEILIHDDASTDKTADIIREYEKKYPNLIKPIYQIENQYSKGVSVELINVERAKGKYIALCEGDDYWTDPYKLQKQVDYMEKHPECSLCVHAGYVVSGSEKKIMSYNRHNRGNKVFKVEEVIEGEGFLTNSMLYPKKLDEKRPHFFDKTNVGDTPLEINLSLQGTVYYIDELMSTYRVGVSGSWRERVFSNVEKKTEHFNEIADMLDAINQYTNGQYENAINRTKLRNQLMLLLEKGKFKEAKAAEYKELYLELGYKQRIIKVMKYYCPSASRLLVSIKRQVYSLKGKLIS